MKYYNLYKGFIMISKRLFITLLIAIFGIIKFISCGSSDLPTESKINEIELPDPEKTGLTTSLPNWGKYLKVIWEKDSEPEEPEQPTFPEDTYYTVYTPFRGENYPKVSYLDVDTLLRYWKEMMGREKNWGRWYIRDGDYDYISDPKKVHHYYFDKNFDLVYHRLGKGTLKIRKLVGAVIVKYYRGKSAGTYTVAGLYENLIENAGQYGWKHFSKFMHAGYNPDNDKREVGDLELLLLNIGFNDQNFDRFGVDSYYNVWAKGLWRDNIHYFIGQSPDIVDNQDPKSYALNQKVNLTYNPGAHNFWFMTAEPEAWELEEHPDTGWVQR